MTYPFVGQSIEAARQPSSTEKVPLVSAMPRFPAATTQAIWNLALLAALCRLT
jgi:hypothetical protein